MSEVELQAPSLSSDDRRRLEDGLAEFERQWEENGLAARVALLPSNNASLRLALLVGLVRIDLRRRWQQGQPVTVESYLATYPELGTPETVAAELIREEYEARCRYGVPADRTDFPRRFPGRPEQLWTDPLPTQAMATSADPGVPTQANLPPADSSTSLPRKSPAVLPELFGRYRIVRQLGRGGMGTVYLAHDTKLDRPVALKVPHFMADDPTALERFYREARVAATLDHPNLCPIHDVGQHEGTHYLTMPYIEGEPLSACLAAGPQVPERQAAVLIRQVALALEEAHRRGIIHRDLKPSNVMLNRRGEPVVMDFGLARQTEAGDVRLTHSGAIVGTPAYMPPEQVDGATTLLGPTCDVYSLGVILYEMLAGRLPFQGGTSQVLCQILRDEPRRPSAYRPGLDPCLEAICQRAMAKRIKERYRSMADLAAALDEFLQAPEAPDLPTLELAAPEEESPLPITPARSDSGRGASVTAEARPVLEALPAEPVPVVSRRRRRWPGGLLLGCLTVVLFFCGGPIVLLMVLAPKAGEKIKEGVSWVGDEIERQKAWSSLALRWKAPPEDADPQELFPTRLGEYQRGDVGAAAPFVEHDIETEGRKTTYRSGAGAVEVSALRATTLERGTLFKRLLDSLENRPSQHRFVQGSADGYRLIYSLGPPEEKGILWWNQGWLFFAFTRDGVDVEAFLHSYLEAISREPKKG